MKTNIIIAGVGGQGILTIAAVLDTAALNENLYVKQSEVHGMSQRGGAVESHVRISDSQVHSDLIPEGKADLIVAVEPMESLRHLPFLKKGGTLITDAQTFVNMDNYPEKKALYKTIQKYPHHLIINATEMAKALGNSKVANIILLGAASVLLPLSEKSLIRAIESMFSSKGEKILALNLEAFYKGKELALQMV
ncbi:indolepyruvate oxidoreductase subunit beta [Namhaeicola litoreus]|uniref:Indolepyruvate oxidoreductase subunit beta n=1 Tax=Namhaeicola litoreus TaxID=1052145 RepID=A0ABW3XZ76_9FLAO